MLRLTVAAVAAAALGGCAPLMRQVGAPLHLPSGLPDTPCERADWIYLVPAEAVRDPAAALRSPGMYRHGGGVAAFRVLADRTTLVWPLAVESVLPEGSGPFLERHFAPLQPHRARRRAGVALMASGAVLALGGLAAGLTVDALTTGAVRDGREEADPLALGLLLGGLLGGITLAVVGYSVVPEPAWMHTIHREHLFYPGDDDLAPVTREVSDRNALTRARCAQERP